MSTTVIAPEERTDETPAVSWISEARTALKEAPVDYFEHSPWQYWFDFLLAMTIAYSAASVYLMGQQWAAALGFPAWAGWALQIAAFPIAVFWLYRLGSLVHEVAHLSSGELTAYKWTWNLLAGVMLLTPSPFFARHHRDHHTNRMYGTREDPEYIVNVFQPGNPLSLLGFAATIAVYPVLVFLRFLLVPLTYVHPAVRELGDRRARVALFSAGRIDSGRAVSDRGGRFFSLGHALQPGRRDAEHEHAPPAGRSPLRKPGEQSRSARPHPRFVQSDRSRPDDLDPLPVLDSLPRAASSIPDPPLPQPARGARISRRVVAARLSLPHAECPQLGGGRLADPVHSAGAAADPRHLLVALSARCAT
jgi:hypothetical protein